MDVFDELAEHVGLKLFDDQSLVLVLDRLQKGELLNLGVRNGQSFLFAFFT